MPGTRDEHGFKASWFKDTFGFEEVVMNWRNSEEKFQDLWGDDRKKKLMDATRERFRMDGETLVAKGGDNGDEERRFHVGSFDVVTLKDLRSQMEAAGLEAPDQFWTCGSLTFKNIVNQTATLYQDPENAGAVFQAASLFNCLETNPMGVEPEDGITVWAADHTQGPASCLSCPAAAVYRTYLCHGGAGQTADHQIDCLSRVAELLNNEAIAEEDGFFMMRGGFCMPSTLGSIGRLSSKIAADPALAERARDQVQVGVHWDTEVVGGSHRVCQVFCSAMPVGLVKSVRAADWAAISQLVLFAGFDATLTAAATLARRRGARVKVFLTLVGGGALGNRRQWIADAIDKALGVHQAEPLDVELVHYAACPKDGPCWRLEHGRGQESLAETSGPERHATKSGLCRATTRQITLIQQEMESMARELEENDVVELADYPLNFEAFDKNGDGVIDRGEFAELALWSTIHADKVAVVFGSFDMNGDGSIDRREFSDILRMVNPTFFTQGTIDLLMDEADADGDGEIHYSEFLSWLYEEDPMIMSKVLDTYKLFQHNAEA